MKKVLLTLIGVLFVVSNASAMTFVLNPDAVLGTAHGKTSVITSLGMNVDTTSTVNPNTGAFTDKGHVAVDEINGPLPQDDADLQNGWYLIGGWNDLAGQAAVNFEDYTYTPGATLTLYASLTPYSGLYEDGGNVGIGDDLNFLDAFYGNPGPTLGADSAVEVARLTLMNAQVGGDAGVGYSVDMDWQFTSFDSAFWLNADGTTPITLGAGESLHIFTDANTDEIVPTVGGQGQPTVIDAGHHGTAKLAVVPEPATMALFGTGLFGLIGAGLRKKRS